MAYYTIDNAPAEIDFECPAGAKRVLQNAKNLLMTRKGEVPYDRERGFDPSIFDKGISNSSSALLKELDRVLAWERDCELKSAKARLLEGGGLYIECTLEID